MHDALDTDEDTFSSCYNSESSGEPEDCSSGNSQESTDHDSEYSTEYSDPSYEDSEASYQVSQGTDSDQGNCLDNKQPLSEDDWSTPASLSDYQSHSSDGSIWSST